MIKLFTHTDLDGVGCAVLAKLAFGDDVDIEYCGYDNIDDRVRNFICEVRPTEVEAIYITDISVSYETAQCIEDEGFKDIVRLFDHHKTAEHLNKYDWCFVAEELEGLKTSGTELFYKHLREFEYLSNNEKYFTFAWAVTMYDTWIWKEMAEEEGLMIKEFNDLLYILGRDEFIDRCIRRKKGRGCDSMITASIDERKILDIRQNEIDAYISRKEKEMFVMTLCGHNAMIVFADRYISQLGNYLCEAYPDYSLAIVIDPGACKVSYRTNKDNVNVGEIAKVFGGGGHPKAAGHIFVDTLRSDMARNLFFYHIGDTVVEPQPEKKKRFLKRLGGNK